MWSFQRYRSWLEQTTNWYRPEENPCTARYGALRCCCQRQCLPHPRQAWQPKPSTPPATEGSGKGSQRIEIEPIESGFGKILKRPGE